MRNLLLHWLRVIAISFLALSTLRCAQEKAAPELETQRAVSPTAQLERDISHKIAETKSDIAGVEKRAPSSPNDPPKRVEPFPGLVVFPEQTTVEVQAWTCLDMGWLEQVMCSAGTREHESLMFPRAQPSHLHAALLMAGFEAGAPGRWWMDDAGALQFAAPTGSKLDIFVRYRNRAGEVVEHPVSEWIRDHQGRQRFPEQPWVFGGSLIQKNPEWMEPPGGEHYLADVTGSIIGLVTFGDEVIGFESVLADQVDVQPAEWEADPETMPEPGTEVTVIIKPWAGRLQ